MRCPLQKKKEISVYKLSALSNFEKRKNKKEAVFF
jgi:hypothetical protein